MGKPFPGDEVLGLARNVGAMIENAVGNVDDVSGRHLVHGELSPDVLSNVGGDNSKVVERVRSLEKTASGGAKRVISSTMDASDLVGAGETRALQFAVACEDAREDDLSGDKGCFDQLGGVFSILLQLLLDLGVMLALLHLGKKALNMAADLGSAIKERERN